MSDVGDHPVGEPVEGGPAVRPPGEPIEGRHVWLEPLDPSAHAAGLFKRSHAAAEDEAIWTYMTYGPFDGVEEMHAWVVANAASTDPRFFAVVDLRVRGPRPSASASRSRASSVRT